MQALRPISIKKLGTIFGILVLINIILFTYLSISSKRVSVINQSKYLSLEYNKKNDKFFISCFKNDSLLSSITITLSDLDKSDPPNGYKNNGVHVSLAKKTNSLLLGTFLDTDMLFKEGNLVISKEDLEVIVYGQMTLRIGHDMNKKTASCLTRGYQLIARDAKLNPFTLKILKR